MSKKEIFQRNVYNFVLDHLEEIKDSPDRLGFKDYTDMLHQIKTNFEIAAWAFLKLMDWGLKENYRKKFTLEKMEDCDYHPIYDFGGQYFTFKSDWSISRLGFSTTWTEVERVTEMIEVTHWREVV